MMGVLQRIGRRVDLHLVAAQLLGERAHSGIVANTLSAASAGAARTASAVPAISFR